VHSTTHSSE